MISLFSRNTKQIQKAWSFDARGIIWRLLVSEDGLIVGEDRQKEAKTASFFCVDSESGEILWRDVTLDQSWWVGLESLHNDVALFHEFAKPDMPEHKKLHVVDLKSGIKLWANENHQFLFAAGNGVFVAHDGFEHRTFRELDLHTGTEVREVDAATINALRQSLPGGEQPVDFPSPFAITDATGESLPVSFRKLLDMPKRPIVLAEQMERNGLNILCSYENVSPSREDIRLNQELIIGDASNGKVLFREQLNADAKVPIPDAFFARGNRIFYIHEKNSLRALDIPTL